MTVGKGDPNYARRAGSRAPAPTAAVSGTDPVSGAPYAAGYAGLPAELEALQAGLLRRPRTNAKQVTVWLQSTLVQPEQAPRRRRSTSTTGLSRIAKGGEQARRRGRTAGDGVAQEPRRRPRPAQRRRRGAGRRDRTARRRRQGAGSGAWPKGSERSAPLQAGLQPSQRAGDRRQGADQPPGAPRRRRLPRPLQLRLLRPLGARRGAAAARAKRRATTIDLRTAARRPRSW